VSACDRYWSRDGDVEIPSETVILLLAREGLRELDDWRAEHDRRWYAFEAYCRGRGESAYRELGRRRRRLVSRAR
jgi:hypothetical protein